MYLDIKVEETKSYIKTFAVIEMYVMIGIHKIEGCLLIFLFTLPMGQYSLIMCN